MKDKLNKFISLIKRDGIFITIKRSINYYSNKILFLIKRTIKKQSAESIEKEIKEALYNEKYDRVVIWRSTFGWDVPLFQRPQHIARCFSEQRTLVLYEVTQLTDKIETFVKEKENLYLVNFENSIVSDLFYKYIDDIKLPKFIQIYSTNWNIGMNEIRKYVEKGYKILYEYIDDLSPVLAGTKELPQNVREKYEYAMSDKSNCYIVVTADELKKDVIAKRGKEKLAFACNGVDYDFFSKIDKKFEFDEIYQNLIEEKKPIIGYYGALASWFDYEMLKNLAQKRPEYNIVLFGIKYDDSFEKQSLNKISNIYFLGSRDYNVLKNYASKFSVCTIPFLINDITKATSPVKLFEYMALAKPIVTTAMHECKKYKSVMIANNKDEFVKLVDKAILMNKKNNIKYFQLLNKEALDNTWSKKAEEIIKSLK